MAMMAILLGKRILVEITETVLTLYRRHPMAFLRLDILNQIPSITATGLVLREKEIGMPLQ